MEVEVKRDGRGSLGVGDIDNRRGREEEDTFYAWSSGWFGLTCWGVVGFRRGFPAV